MVIDRGGKFLDDAESFRAVIRQMPNADLRDEYESYGALSKESAFPNRRMVVYTLLHGRPERLSGITFGDLEVSRRDGPAIDLVYESRNLRVGISPVKLGGRDLFLQVPQTFELKWKGKLTEGGIVQFVPTYAVLFKTRSKEFHQIDGHTYVLTMNKFKERFPGVNVRY